MITENLSQVSLKLMRQRVTTEGETIHDMQDIRVSPDTTNEACVFFVWPLDIVHIIDEESPFFDMSASDISREQFELVVVMEGTIESSSMNFQTR